MSPLKTTARGAAIVRARVFFAMRQGRWQGFALFLALVVLFYSTSLLLYPDPFAISKGYAAMASIGSATAWGTAGLITSAISLLLLGTHNAALAVPFPTIYIGLVAANSYISIGLSPGTSVWAFMTFTGMMTFFLAGGWPPRR